MISNQSSSNGNGTFSANVKLSLHADGEQIEVASLGPGFALLRRARSVEATQAEIETIVDDKVTRQRIRITTPLDGTTKRFEFEGG